MPSKPAASATTVASARPAGATPTLYIDGSWAAADGGATFEATSHATGADIGTLAQGGRVDASRAIEAAARSAPAWGRTSSFERAAALERIAGVIEARGDEK